MSSRAPTGEDGLVATPTLLVLWVGLLLTIVVIDVGGYLVAATRAQAAADAAALAAVSADLERAPPRDAAASVAARNGARLERCGCRAGAGRAEVEASVPVPGLFVARVTGMQRVTAVAAARLEGPSVPSAPAAPSAPVAPVPSAPHPPVGPARSDLWHPVPRAEDP